MGARSGTPFVPWTDAEGATLLRLRAQGLSFRAIAARIPGRSDTGLEQRHRLMRLGLAPVPPGCTRPGQAGAGAVAAPRAEPAARKRPAPVERAIEERPEAPRRAQPSHAVPSPPEAEPQPSLPPPACAALTGQPIAVAAQQDRPARAPRECTWLSGDRPFVGCSEPAVPGKSWCEAHCQIGFVRHASRAAREAADA